MIYAKNFKVKNVGKIVGSKLCFYRIGKKKDKKNGNGAFREKRHTFILVY